MTAMLYLSCKRRVEKRRRRGKATEAEKGMEFSI